MLMVSIFLGSAGTPLELNVWSKNTTWRWRKEHFSRINLGCSLLNGLAHDVSAHHALSHLDHIR